MAPASPRSLFLALALVMGAAAHPAPVRAEATATKAAKAPAWDRDELKQIFVRIQAAASAPTVEAKDRGLVDAAAAAYRKTPSPASVEDMAKDVLRARDPEHPAVQKGQWLTALTRRLYLDLSERCDLVSRFSNTRDDRRYFESMAQQTKAVAQQLGEGLVLVVEGLDVETEALPAVGGSAPTEQGVVAWVHNGGVVTIQKLDRVRFVDHRPPPEHARTTTGALREVYGAQKQFNTFAQTMGKYDSATRGQFGHVQVILPAAYPAIYLNEIVRGGVEAGMHTLHLKTMTPRGELRELVLGIGDAKVVKKKGRGKKKAAVKPEVVVGCEDAVPMGDCAKKLQHALEAGAARYAPK